MNKNKFSYELINWYKSNKRMLPWRKTSDPYKIWLSEVILQQTRVNQGLPYYHKFLKKFNSINDLANANETEVFKVWQGLGYYSRVKNLIRCAKQVVNEYDGEFPSSYKELIKLPGIGSYTAAAIASFAFKEKVAVLDGNVFRVLSRIFGICEDISLTKNKIIFEKKANEIISSEFPDTYNQAIMEFGALHCKPKNPNCHNCIFINNCYAFKHNVQHELPLKSKVIKKKKRFFNYIVLKNNNKYILKKRKNKDVWKELYDFPLLENDSLLTLDLLLEKTKDLKFRVDRKNFEGYYDYKHTLTHQTIFARFFSFIYNENDSNSLNSIHNYYDIEEIKQIPLPILISNYIKEQLKL